ncbi:MAG TPA: ABC transporter permease [Terriglobales bacterium]|nr:ABC transporter permease [Terriglobales bacterium]
MSMLQNLRYALRQLRRNPGFATIAVLTLALGIGATTAMYTVNYATLLAPMPYPHPEQLVMLWTTVRGDRNDISAGDFLDWKQQSTIFQDLNAWTGGSFNLTTADHPEELSSHITTPGWFKMQGFHFALGRDFLPEEGEIGREHEVILTDQLWQRLGADRNILGKQLRLNGEGYTVVGVLAPGVADRMPAQVAIPLAFRPEQINHDFNWLLVMGRLKPGVSIAQANAQMNVIAKHIAEAHPASNKGRGISVEPLRNDFIDRSTIVALWLLMGAVSFVLLIGCANLANLLLARASVRQREVAIRASVGARRRELFAQFMTESLVLAVLGGIAGIGFGQAFIRLFVALVPPNTLPSEADIRINAPVLVCCLAVTIFSALLFGSAPAWQSSGVDPNTTLKEGGSAGTSSRRQRLRRVLVVGEFALALTLLTSAALLIHNFWNVIHVDSGIRTDHVLTFNVHAPQGRLAGAEQTIAFYRELLAKLEALPGVSSAEVATGIPLLYTEFNHPFTVVGGPIVDAALRPTAGFQSVTPGYFQTFGIQLVRGRTFNEQDVAGSTPVAVVNENFVRRYLHGADPLSQRIEVPQVIPGSAGLGPPVQRQVVGVFHDVRTGGVANQNFSEIDVPFWQTPWPSTNLAVRTAGDPADMTKSIAAAVASVGPDLAVTDVRTMDQIQDENRAGDRFGMILFGSFASFALLLAGLGIYGVMAFTVAQRTHEIGLRVALGAGRDRVLTMILREGVRLAVIGTGFGLVGAIFVGRVMSSMLYRVGTVDLKAFAGVAVVLLSTALLACYIPARRAAKVDPMVALRYE